ncbi:hypothetical protein FisN_16Hh093 [Fistulifera solaris]|uniref:MARVEL domain-containing protein n=1 Tax=Fistulifera solaris TaxID=1519565 RepID=A0A1Z5KTM5_FISSO|nr:hypothetical protein FisN_16Hh093 [Fistulifera solaris]|eukprot:GAX29465.1 hypothetical protein FisN_16Hh093 [Fistulifera solaris]
MLAQDIRGNATMNPFLESPPDAAEEHTVLLSKTSDEDLSPAERIFPRRSCALRSFKILSSFAIAVSAVLLGAQIAAMAVFHFFFMPNVLRLYIVAFCIILILTELRMENLVPTTYENWVYRGFLYSFIGLIGVVMAEANEVEERTLETRQMIVHLVMLGASYAMFALGVIYMLMGFCCLRDVLERMRADYDADVDRASLEESIT